MPEWAKYIMAARWLKVAPWDLMAQGDADFFIEATSVLSSALAEAASKKSK